MPEIIMWDEMSPLTDEQWRLLSSQLKGGWKMPSKNMIQSKTFWLNAVALGVAAVQYFLGALPEVDAEQFSIVVAVANIVLRRFTSQPVKVLPEPK